MNFAGFYNKYKNIQVQKFQAGGPPIIYNGPEAKSYGVDVDFEVRPVAALKIRGTLEALHSEFTKFDQADICTPRTVAGSRARLSAGYGRLCLCPGLCHRKQPAGCSEVHGVAGPDLQRSP